MVPLVRHTASIFRSFWCMGVKYVWAASVVLDQRRWYEPSNQSMFFIVFPLTWYDDGKLDLCLLWRKPEKKPYKCHCCVTMIYQEAPMFLYFTSKFEQKKHQYNFEKVEIHSFTRKHSFYSSSFYVKFWRYRVYNTCTTYKKSCLPVRFAKQTISWAYSLEHKKSIVCRNTIGLCNLKMRVFLQNEWIHVLSIGSWHLLHLSANLWSPSQQNPLIFWG